MSDRATLVQFYIAFYNRAPDPAGLFFWQTACDTGLPLASIADLFVPQNETIALYPFLANPTEEGIRSFLQTVYQNLFNRDLDDAGETFWTNQVLASDAFTGEDTGNGLSLGEVVLSIITGAQGDDITTLANKTEIALDWHDQAALDPEYEQTQEATTASRLALGVVDETDFSLVQGRVLNENFFEEDDGTTVDVTPEDFDPGDFRGSPNDPDGVFIVGANGFTLGNQLSPDVVVLESGKAVVAYINQPEFGGLRSIGLRTFNADGTIDGPDGEIFAGDEDRTVDRLSITALPDGGYVVAASISNEQPVGPQQPELIAHRFDAAGNPFGDPFQIDLAELGNVVQMDVTYSEDGTLLFNYNAAGDITDGVLQTFFVKTSLTGEVVVGPTNAGVSESDNREDDSASASLSDGTTLVVSLADDFDNDVDDGLFARIFDAEGNPDGNFFPITDANDGDQRDPHVVALDNDTFVVVYRSDSEVGGDTPNNVNAVIIDNNGNVLVREFTVNTDALVGGATEPDVAVLDDGNFVVVWRDFIDSDIGISIFEPDGTRVLDTSFDPGPSSDNDPSVAASEDGFVVSWRKFFDFNNPLDLSEQGVQFAAFENDGSPILLPNDPNPQIPFLIDGTTQAPLIVFSRGDSTLSEQEVLNSQPVPLDGTDFDIVAVRGRIFDVEYTLDPSGNIEVESTPFSDWRALGSGEQLVESFIYTVENESGDRVDLVGNYIVEGNSIL